MTENELRETLVRTIKEVGQEVTENAEELLGSDPYLTSLRIVIDWTPSTGNDISKTIPTIEVTKEHYSKNAIKIYLG